MLENEWHCWVPRDHQKIIASGYTHMSGMHKCVCVCAHACVVPEYELNTGTSVWKLSGMVTAALLPLLLYATFLIQATKLGSFHKDETARIWPSQNGPLEWQNQNIDAPWCLKYLGGEQEQVSAGRTGFISVGPCSRLPSSSLLFPFWAWLRWGGRPQGYACCQLTTSLGVSKKESQCPGHFSFSIPIWIY